MYYLDMKDKEGAIVLTMVIGDKEEEEGIDWCKGFVMYMRVIKLIKKKEISRFILLIRVERILSFAQAGNSIASANLLSPNLRAVELVISIVYI